LKPHLVKTFKLSNDKHFVEKVQDVVGLYLDPPDKAIVFSVDEKSQIQALVLLDDILRVLREKVHRGASPYAAPLVSWSERRFLRHIAEAHLRRTVVPGMIENWLKAASGAPVERVEAPAAVPQAPPRLKTHRRRPPHTGEVFLARMTSPWPREATLVLRNHGEPKWRFQAPG
jgi:hypothetical protein